MSYLIQFPIDILKIDRSLIHNIGSTSGKGIIVSAVIAMGTSLNQQVIAEGVEEQGRLDFLRASNCEEDQGYFFNRPLAVEPFITLLKTGISASNG